MIHFGIGTSGSVAACFRSPIETLWVNKASNGYVFKPGGELFMAAKYDIFKKTPENMVIWVEEVEDISQARKRLISLAASAPAEYRLFSQSLERFVEPDDDCA
jgi:hypothetical protein